MNIVTYRTANPSSKYQNKNEKERKKNMKRKLSNANVQDKEKMMMMNKEIQEKVPSNGLHLCTCILFSCL